MQSHPNKTDAPLFCSAKMATFEPPTMVNIQHPPSENKQHPPLYKAHHSSSPSSFSSSSAAPPTVLTPSATEGSQPNHNPHASASAPAVAKCGWDCPQLTTVGLYYPLGPCQVRLGLDRLGDVLATLPRLFQQLSFCVEYTHTPIAATCRTLDRVELEVALFASRACDQELIVEVERKDGDSVLYHQHAHHIVAVLKALADGTAAVSDNTQPCADVASSSNLGVGLLAQADSILLQHETTDVCINDALETALGLAASNQRYDEQRLGLESLVQLTHPGQSGWSVAQRAAAALLSADDDALWQRAAVENNDDESSFLSLVVLAQCLQVAVQNQQISLVAQFAQRHTQLVSAGLVPLVHNQRNPHRTYHATTCLAALCHAAPTLLRPLLDCTHIYHAQQMGHAALATATEQLLQALQAQA